MPSNVPESSGWSLEFFRAICLSRAGGAVCPTLELCICPRLHGGIQLLGFMLGEEGSF